MLKYSVRKELHVILFYFRVLNLDIADVISFTFGRMTSMPRTRKQLPSWVVYKLEFCQENRGMKCRGTKPPYWRARGAWKKKKELTSFKMVIFFVCFLPPRFLFYMMVVFFRVNDKAAKGPITTGYAKGWIIIVLNFFITLTLKWRIFQLIILILCTEFLFVHTLMFIISVNSFLKMKNCVSTLRLLNYIRNTLLVYRRSKVNPWEMFGEYNEKSLT